VDWLLSKWKWLGICCRKIPATHVSYHRLVLADNRKSSRAGEIRFDRTSRDRVLSKAKGWTFAGRGFVAIENTGSIYRRTLEMELTGKSGTRER